MKKVKNYFGEKLGSFIIEDAPLIGEYEYYYTNTEILVKVDQYGINMVQAKPPADIALIKRETVKLSPWRIYFSIGGKVFHNFDFLSAKKHKIEFSPVCAIYQLTFEGIKITTELMVTQNDCRVIMKTTFKNIADKPLKFKVMPYVSAYANDLMMAPWDKPEWYTKTSVKEKNKPIFETTRYSVEGKAAMRRYIHCIMDGGAVANDISAERIFAYTKNFTLLDSIENVSEEENGLYAFEQAYGSLYEASLNGGEERTFTQVLCLVDCENEKEQAIRESERYFDIENLNAEKTALDAFYNELLSVNEVLTFDKDFNTFVNSFLPLELFWVSKLDRGWPTGMRGVRDASNDFMGMLTYDLKECRNILIRLLSCQRSDGWFPRQIPMKGDKFDLRPFMDGGNFVIEFAYHYLTYSHDHSLLEEVLPYYDSEVEDKAIDHLIKGVEFYLEEDNIGEHGICKINGGDWLDTLSGAGLLGKGESVMVTLQLIMSLEYMSKIMQWTNIFADKQSEYLQKAQWFKDNINKHSLNEKGFYNAVYTDNGEWIFSDSDPDGETRPYIPTNAYSIISGVSDSPEKIIEHLKSLKSGHGYRLFYPPMGKKYIALVGKMGTGDLQPGFGENGNPYNHGSHGFLIRALAKSGSYEMLYDALNYMMPYNPKFHSPEKVCAAPYAMINVYQSVPMFDGRAGFLFLTGSVAMLFRAIYNWMVGIEFTFGGIEIKPCIPKEFLDLKIQIRLANNKNLEIQFLGYGNKVMSSSTGIVKSNVAKINKDEVDKIAKITIELDKQL